MEIILPPKVNSYLDKIKEKTKKDIVFRPIGSSHLPPGIYAAFSPEGGNINVFIVPTVLKEVDDDLYRAIVHEATHGLLVFDEGYYNIKPRDVELRINEEEKQIRNMLSTMIDDIVVNYKIQKEGFAPFGKNYLPQVKEEIKLINKGINPYKGECLRVGEIYCSKIKTFRYMTAWGFIKYFKLEDNILSLLKRYLTCFRNNFFEEYKECKKITKLLNDYDIFSPKGHKIVCERILKLWGLDKKMKMIKSL
ncbi:MAG: hypothetical protein ACKKMV_03080 [Candidatus Nealsonbacteria bacterium]